MKLLAKSIAVPAQIDSRKALGTDGIEILLIHRDFYDGSTWNPEKAKKTEETLLATVTDPAFGTLALEMADSVDRYGIQPVSDDSATRQFSQDLLRRVVDMANRLNAAAPGKVGYFQYQLIFEPFGPHGIAPAYSREGLLGRLAEFHATLQKASDIPLQIENGIRVNPAFTTGTPTESVITITIDDYAAMGVPLALDTAHYAQTLDLYADAQHVEGDTFKIHAPSKRKPEGETFYFRLTEEQEEIARCIRENPSRQDAITSELERVLREHGNIIGSMQFSSAKNNKGYGINDVGAGYPGTDGLVDVSRVLRAAIGANVPFVIPGYGETDYATVPNQRAGIAMVRELQNPQKPL